MGTVRKWSQIYDWVDWKILRTIWEAVRLKLWLVKQLLNVLAWSGVCSALCFRLCPCFWLHSDVATEWFSFFLDPSELQRGLLSCWCCVKLFLLNRRVLCPGYDDQVGSWQLWAWQMVPGQFPNVRAAFLFLRTSSSQGQTVRFRDINRGSSPLLRRC